MNIETQLSQKIATAMIKTGIAPQAAPLIKPTHKAAFGDYQANGIIAAAKKMGLLPRELAARVIANLDNDAMIARTDIAGPGFINLFLNDAWLNQQGDRALADAKLAVTLAAIPQTIVIDYSAPNVAKEMHVGHLRSTILGDAAVRILTFLGHKVIRANHIGDWGTQFGMLIALLEKKQYAQTKDMHLADLETFYREAKQYYDSDAEFAEKARQYVVKLQSGDAYCRRLWRQLVEITMAQNMAIYRRLNVTLTDADTAGESTYNVYFPEIIQDLKDKLLATENEGATVVYLEEFSNKQGEPMGVIVQKRDGGYLYATTDIACARYRIQQLQADRILYYTDSRQHQHLQQVWLIGQKAGYIPPSFALEHHMFGMMLGKDGRPFKTRTGDTVKLNHLLDEAEKRAEALLRSKNSNLTEAEIKAIGEAIAIGAVKYADLSKNRTTDYVFDWDNMLSFEGNTAPYLQYAYTRLLSLFRKANLDMSTIRYPIHITGDTERILLLKLLQFDETIQTVAKEGFPHLLATYLYELATVFSRFYEQYSILNADSRGLKESRLALAALTARTLATGLSLLGIKTIEKM